MENTALRTHRPERRIEKVNLCKCEECSRRIPDRRNPAPESVPSLPPLDRPRFFEAAARLRRFARAGRERG